MGGSARPKRGERAPAREAASLERWRIHDDGVGFAPSELDRGRPGHLGAAAMRERAALAGGWLRMESVPGVGTTVEFWLPDDGPDEAGP